MNEHKERALLRFEIGTLSKDEVEDILNTLPADIIFVDKEDIVRYFNRPKERLFAFAKDVIGTKVQQCHSQKSMHMLNKILENFKSGKKDVAELWHQRKDGVMLYVRYFAVRKRDGEYIGTLEFAQDIAKIKKIEGEKRLLDWKD